MGTALLLLLPTGAGGSGAILLIFLATPIYMLHQIEEHTGDRFRRYVNRTVFGGVEALSVSDVLWINLPGVWGMNLLALYAAHFIDIGWGLAAGYLMLINGIAHVGMAARFKGYNPGLVTGVVLFIPLGLLTALLVPASALQQVVGFLIAVVIHAAIIVRVKSNVAAAQHASAGHVAAA
jgi:hypothetical protein